MNNEKREYQKVIDYLKDLTQKGTIKIGSKLPTERSLSETLSISRNSTREALRMLENMGVIECRHGSGNYVVGNVPKAITSCIDMMLLLNEINIDEISAFRRNMEKGVCLYIINKGLSEKSSRHLAEILKEEESSSSFEELIKLDYEFHYSLIEATENYFWIAFSKAVIDVYRRMIEKSFRTMSKHENQQVMKTHSGIYNSLVNGDWNSCEKWIDNHYDIVDEELKGGPGDEV